MTRARIARAALLGRAGPSQLRRHVVLYACLAPQRDPRTLFATRNCNVYLRADVEALLAARGGRITAGRPKKQVAAK